MQSIPQPVADVLDTALVDSEKDKEILEQCLASYIRADQMLETCTTLTEQCQKTILVLKCKISQEEDEILYQIDQLNDWLEDTYNMFTWIPNNLPYAYQYLIVDWKKKFNDMGIKYGDRSFPDSIMLPGESSVDAEVVDLEPEPSIHTAECIAGMIEVISLYVFVVFLALYFPSTATFALSIYSGINISKPLNRELLNVCVM